MALLAFSTYYSRYPYLSYALCCPQVVSAVIESGQFGSNSNRSRVPLMYEWYGENYYGAAHGVAGILYMLFQVRHDWCPIVEDFKMFT